MCYAAMCYGGDESNDKEFRAHVLRVFQDAVETEISGYDKKFTADLSIDDITEDDEGQIVRFIDGSGERENEGFIEELISDKNYSDAGRRFIRGIFYKDLSWKVSGYRVGWKTHMSYVSYDNFLKRAERHLCGKVHKSYRIEYAGFKKGGDLYI